MAENSGGFWRRGVPLVAGMGGLSAAVLAVLASWEFDVASLPDRMREGAVAATAFSATLLLLCRVARVKTEPVVDRTPRRGETVAAAVVISIGIAFAALDLDVPLRHDEARTALIYSTQPFSVVASTYDSTNDHVLHTLLVRGAHLVGGWDRVWLRLPAFLSFCLLLPALWWFARREYGSTAALFAVALAASSPFFVHYAINARGYTLLLLLFTAAMLCAQTLVRTPNNKALWATWATATGMGFFTLPIMMFAATATVAWMLLARWRACGREALGSFLATTATWSAVAAAVAGALYAPALITEGATGVLDALTHTYADSGGRNTAATRGLLLLTTPAVLWWKWHLTMPSWAQGALLALVVAGVAVRARTCGSRGTLLLALIVPGALLLPTLFPLPPRMAIWALAGLVVLAGAGAAFLVERTVAWAGARWPIVARAPRRPALKWCATILLLGVFAEWASGQRSHPGRREQPELLAMAAVVADRAEPGDHFHACERVVVRSVLYMKAFHRVEERVRIFRPLPDSDVQWHVHRLSAPSRGLEPAAPSAPTAGGRPQRLFLFEPWAGGGTIRCDWTLPPISAVLETHWPEHELVAAFADGRVYAVNQPDGVDAATTTGRDQPVANRSATPLPPSPPRTRRWLDGAPADPPGTGRPPGRASPQGSCAADRPG